jgi:hypothetical protein
MQFEEYSIYETFSKVYGITIFLFDHAGTLLSKFSPNAESSEFLLTFSMVKERFFSSSDLSHHPQIISSELN